ncbi:MAG: DUF1351 domain-containing protein [Bacilli bacterium]|nr:DUF1351 domain-containing protein [Bacilli bacterium]
MEQEIKDVEVAEEKELIKPEFKEEPKADIKTLGTIEDNIKELKQYATNLSEYYKQVSFTSETLKEAKDEKADVNKFKNKVKGFVKEVEDKWNKPLENFKKDVKETVNLLENTYETINNQVLKYENETKEKIKEKCISYFNEYALSKKVDFVEFSQTNISITLGLVTEKGQLTKKAKDSITDFIDKVVSDIALINSQPYEDEILIEYKKDLNVSKAICEVTERHKQLEQAKIQKEEKKEQELTDEVMLNKIDNCLKAPKIEKIETQNDEILELNFKVRASRTKLKQLKEFLDKGGYDYE